MLGLKQIPAVFGQEERYTLDKSYYKTVSLIKLTLEKNFRGDMMKHEVNVKMQEGEFTL